MGYFAPIRQDEYPATDETQCVVVYIPAGDEYKALLAGFVAMLSDPYSYEDPLSAQADGIAATFDQGYSQINWNGCGIPPECYEVTTNILLIPINMTVASGNGVIQTIDTAQRFNTTYQQNAPVQFQALSSRQWMASGEWAYRITGLRQSGSGILTFAIDDSDGDNALTTTHDFYNASTQRNHFFTGTFTLAVSGDTGINFETNSKHASSSGYANLITCLEMWKTDEL